MDAFISHSSKNAATAARLEKALQAQGLDVWLDDSELGLGVMLGTELRESMRSARALVLLWSKPASESRWVCSEWLTALWDRPRSLAARVKLPRCARVTNARNCFVSSG